MVPHTIEIEAFEAVVPGGVRRVTWLVESGDEWIVAGEVPGASVERGEGKPGLVWLQRVTLTLEPGARLVRVESAPRRAPPRDPLAYLFEPERARPRETRRNQFIVNVAGKLERVAPARP